MCLVKIHGEEMPGNVESMGAECGVADMDESEEIRQLIQLLDVEQNTEYCPFINSKMAGSHTSTCSSSYENYTLKNNNNDQKNPKCSLLSLSGNDLIWEGDLESLKSFVETELQINGRWSTPRGEKFKFSNPEFSLKWDGVTDKTITVMQDNDESQLYNTLRSYATLTNAIIDENLQNEIEHMANVDTEADETSHDISAESDNKQNSCEQCDSYKDDLAKLLVMIS